MEVGELQADWTIVNTTSVQNKSTSKWRMVISSNRPEDTQPMSQNDDIYGLQVEPHVLGVAVGTETCISMKDSGLKSSGPGTTP